MTSCGCGANQSLIGGGRKGKKANKGKNASRCRKSNKQSPKRKTGGSTLLASAIVPFGLLAIKHLLGSRKSKSHKKRRRKTQKKKLKRN